MFSRKPTLLCVDDDSQCLTVRRIVFEAHGFKVLTSLNPKRGLKLFKSKSFDAAILDFQMPEMNGAELAREMKKMRPQVPVVILSGLPQLPDDAPTFHDKFFCKTESAFKIAREVQRLIGIEPTGPLARKPGSRLARRVSAAAGVATGIAVQGMTQVFGRAKAPAQRRLAFKSMGHA